MYNHCIIMSSAYSIGKRIALHYINLNEIEMKSKIDFIMNKCGKDISLSTHYIMTEKDTWKSVVDFDKFFLNVKLIDNINTFVDLILKDRELIGLDVAKYITSRCSCTHLKLEKLTYFCYAEYLCLKKEKLFNDTIYAYRLGPVIDSVYKKYRKKAFLKEEDNKVIYDDKENSSAIKSRIIASKNGLDKISIIEKTLKKYGHLKASDLVNLTHRDNSPWYISGRGKDNNKVIEDISIINNHCYETL